MTAICAFLLKISGGVITAAIGGVIGYLSAVRVSRLNAKAAAAAKLRAAFSNAQAWLAIAISHKDDFTRPNVSDILRDDFIRHASAIEEFRPFVRPEDRDAYQQAWEEYCNLKPMLWDGGILEPPNEREEAEVIFNKKIHAILSYATT